MRSKHDAAIANFGVPNYGGYMIGSVVYAGQGAYGCDSFDKTFKPKFPRPTILIIDRGGNCFIQIVPNCKFLVRNRKFCHLHESFVV